MSGSTASFDGFVLTRGATLLRFAYSLTGDRGLAEDLVQDALVKAFRRWGEVALERPEAYVRRIIVNTFLSWHRRRSSKELPGPVPDRVVGDGTDAFVQRDLVWHVLAGLPRRQRAVLVLRYYEGLPDVEVAALLGCAEGTVRSLAARAFESLRRHPQLSRLGGPHQPQPEPPSPGQATGDAMNELEALVRDTLVSHAADESPDPARLLRSVHDRAAPDRRRIWSVVGLSAAASVAVVLGVGALMPGERTNDEPAAEPTGAAVTPAATPVATPSVPAGQQAVSFHGVEVLVPATWTINDVKCSAPVSDTVVVPAAFEFLALCAGAQPPGLTVVRLLTAEEDPWDRAFELATSPATVSGQPARRGIGPHPWDGTSELAVLALPTTGVVVTVESPDRALAGQLLDAVRITPIDSAGCRDRRVDLGPPHDAERSVQGATLVPGRPVSGAICRYSRTWLAASESLAPADVDRLVDILNGLPANLTPPAPNADTSPDACAADEGRGFVLQIGYANASTVDVYVRIGGCNALSARTATRSAGVDDALVSFLVSAVAYDGRIPIFDDLG